MRRSVLVIGLLLLSTAANASPPNRWLHIRVTENAPDGEKVRVNVPLMMVEKLLPLIDDEDFCGGKIRFNRQDMNAVRLRAIWSAVRDTEDGEFVTVESKDENVRVAREGAYLLVKVQEHGRRGEQVDVKVPVSVVDGLLSGEGDELNIGAAIQALGEHGPGELVTVNSDDENVRIWIDMTQSGNGEVSK
jgi:hypothetical protein